jgi:signal transduction histidine kinase
MHRTSSPSPLWRDGTIAQTTRKRSDVQTGPLTVAMLNALTRLLDARPRSRVVQLAVAIIAVGAAFGVTLIIREWTPHAVFMLFLPAVMISAWYGQLLIGTIATLLSVLLVSRFVLQSSLLDEIEFTTVATLVAMATSALASAQRRIHDLQADVANEHTRRTEAEALALDEQARRTEAELSSRAKTDFLSILGHELRQPLGVILTAAESLEKAPDIRTRERAKRTIDRQAGLMTRLVEDLLDLSRIPRGVLDLRKDTVDGAQLFDEIAQAVHPTMSQRDQRFTVSIPPVPTFVRVDAARLRQIASNLLTNATKYTGAGGDITLTVDARGDTLQLRVRDTGRGIAADVLPTVFDLYQRSNPEGGGMGIGLAVVKALTEAHGGTVAAISQGSGRGAEFIVTLPGVVLPRAVAAQGA